MTHLASQSPPTPPSSTNAQAHDRPVQTLRCKNTADLLAALPLLTRFTATNSLYIVCFLGNRGGSLMRIDLPVSEARVEISRFVEALVRLLVDSGAGAAGPALIISTAEQFSSSGQAPRSRLAREVKRRIRREGWRLRDLAVLAPNGWCGMLGAETGTQQPLSEIEHSPIAAVVSPREHAPLDLHEVGKLSPADPDRKAAVEALLDELTQRASGRTHMSLRPASLLQPAPLVYWRN